MIPKEQILTICQTKVQEDISRINQELANCQIAMAEETKSSAGDKYETGREMLNQEMHKLNVQLENVLKLQKTLESIRPSKANTNVALGSLVKTSGALYFIAASLGKIQVQDQRIFVISAVSPIGKAMQALGPGETFELNGQQMTIQEVS